MTRVFTLTDNFTCSMLRNNRLGINVKFALAVQIQVANLSGRLLYINVYKIFWSRSWSQRVVSKFACLDFDLGLGKIIGSRSRSRRLWSRLHHYYNQKLFKKKY